MSVKSYRDLEAWQLAMKLAVMLYELSARLPREELYGLTAQLRRAAVSIASNVAEGHRRPTKSYRHFLGMALGSLAEVETQIELARRLGFVSDVQLHRVNDATAELGRVLHGLRRRLSDRIEATS